MHDLLLIVKSEKCGDFSFSFTVMLLEFAATPGSLQKSFLKRKQNFIQESLKRVEAIKNKERENEKPQARKLLGGKSENLRSRQKESGLLSGKFMWGARHNIRYPFNCCFISKNRFYICSMFAFANWVILQFIFSGDQGASFSLSGCLCCKSLYGGSSYFTISPPLSS